MTRQDIVNAIAKTAHEVNRAYCESMGDVSQRPWDEAPDWQKDSARNGVFYHLGRPDSTPEDSHLNWMREKLAAGWVYGPVKNAEAKTHPCLTAYSALPESQRAKDALFITVVRCLEPLYAPVG